MSDSRRIGWIDTLRGIGIFYVTFAHLFPWLPIEKHIYSFHMFLFFFLSGYLYNKPKSIKLFVCKKAKNLLIPFAFWNALSTAIEIFINGNFVSNISKMFTVDGNLCWNAPIWFLLVLFFVEIIFSAFDRIPVKKLHILIPLIVAAVSLVIAGFTANHNMIFKITIIPIGLFYYCIGYIVRSIPITVSNLQRIIILLFAVIINGIFAVILNDRISVVRCYYGNFIYCLIGGVSGIIIYLIISKFLNTKLHKIDKYICRIGTNSMIIMCTQYYFFRIYNAIAGYDIWHHRSTVKALILSVLTIVLIELFVFLVKKLKNNYLNNLIGIK